jgi:hypothetical protein
MSRVEELLEQILEELRLQRKERQSPTGYDWNVLLDLPDHVRKTALVLAQQGRATAGDVSGFTHRARALESLYLNQLVVLKKAKKERVGRKVYFSRR